MRVGRWALNVIQNRMGAVPRPSWCTYIVTFVCNARCQMCDSWQMPRMDELTVDEVSRSFGQIGKLDVVRITGGEPFVRKDLGGIAEAILRQSRPMVIHITTNGSMPERVASFVEGFSEAGKLRFMVSFDGLPEVHDANRGKGVSFSRAKETVEVLAGLREKHGLEVSVNHTVISKASLEDHGELRRQMASLGVDVHSVLAYADSSMYSVTLHGKNGDHLIVPKGYPLHPDLAGADVDGFVSDQLRLSQESSSALLRRGKRYYLRGLQARLRGEAGAKPKPRCVALRSHLRILPDGGVPICQFNTEVVGNLREESFDSLWKKSNVAEARRWVDACPGCWAECEVMPNAIYTGDILRY